MALKMRENVFVLIFSLTLLFGGVCCVSPPSSPARIVNGVFSNTYSMLMKWVLSLKATTKTAISGRPMMKFEGGYNVETVFDGSKLGIEPYAVHVLPDGDLLIMDSANSNLYKISSSLSLYSRPRLVSGSGDGYAGHVDGKLREARMNHPKGLTVDDRGNIYIADTDNMAIRKISDTGVTTIAGGKWVVGGGHVDGPSEDAKFSNDFDVVYLGSSCSLLVIDRGNKAMRQIQLNFEDCAYQYGSGFPLGIAVLAAAGFFGYMLALLQRRIGLIVSSENEATNESFHQNPYEKPLKSSWRAPLVPTEDEQEKQEESFLGSLMRLVAHTGESAAEILGGVFPMLNKKQSNPRYPSHHKHQQQQQLKYSSTWPAQESYVIPHEDEPPSIERVPNPTPKKTYAFMTKDTEKMQQLRQSRAFYSGWDGDLQKQQTKMHQHRHQYHSPATQTYYEQSPETTNEIVFGAVQEQEMPLDHGIPLNDHYNIRSRSSYNYDR